MLSYVYICYLMFLHLNKRKSIRFSRIKMPIDQNLLFIAVIILIFVFLIKKNPKSAFEQVSMKVLQK